jgi:hydroxyacylglutathione hydrolase
MTAAGMPDSSSPNVVSVDSTGLGDRTYIVHDDRVALVIDPQRDIDRVERLIADHGLTITHVAETHFHNDYVSGGRELAAKHGATYIIPSGLEVAFDATHIGDGDTFTVGDLEIEAVHTPGHTPNHMSYVARSGDAGVVFTGGSLLYGSVGRPDLVAPEVTEDQAHDQWHSAHKLASQLPDETPIYPTHGFGSFCAATQAQGLSSTLGNEKSVNPALTGEEQDFVDTLLAGLDVFPAYYAHMGPANVAGAPDVNLDAPVKVDADQLRSRAQQGEWIVDLRSREIFAAGHLPGAINFDLSGSFINYLAWMMPWGTPITLVGSSEDEVAQAQRELVRVGIDGLRGAAVGAPDAWATDPARLATMRRVTFRELADETSGGESPCIVDTRQILEWEAGHIKGALFIPFYDVMDRLAEIPVTRPVYVHCGSGYRAAAVVSLLQAAGRNNLVLVDDEFDNASKAGFILVQEHAPAREPGWTWIASRAAARSHVGPLSVTDDGERAASAEVAART